MSPITPGQHLQNISEGGDKSNALKFLDGKVTIKEKGDGRFFIDVDGNELDLGVVKAKHLPYLQKVVETLIVEKSVCEARMYLSAQCKGEVTKRGSTPLYSGPDIEFNTSSWKNNIGIVKHETLSSIYKTNNVRQIAEEIVNFVNTFPKNYIPLSVIEAPTDSISSYTKSKKK